MTDQDVLLPRLSDSMEEGTISKWLRSEGEEVVCGDEIVEIETDKATMSYTAECDGELRIIAKEGDTLPVGAPIARISDSAGRANAQRGGHGSRIANANDDATQPRNAPLASVAPGLGVRDPGTVAPEEPPQGPADPAAAAAQPHDAHRAEKVKASPLARRLARDMNLDLSAVQGSGPGGRITRADVEAASRRHVGTAAVDVAAEIGSGSATEPPASLEGSADPNRESSLGVPAAFLGEVGRGETRTQDPTRVQQTIARRMSQSKASAPEFMLSCEVDMEAAIGLREQLRALALEANARPPSINDFVIKASALALRDFPRANGAYINGRFEFYDRVNVGIAVAGQDVLVVPTVFDADRKSLGQIASEAHGLTERVRSGAITPRELASATFTVSNLGMYGLSSFVAVINPPQAAILAVATMEPRCVVVDGEVQVRSRMTITLSCDHRMLYGAEAAQFLTRIRKGLEQPLVLLGL